MKVFFHFVTFGKSFFEYIGGKFLLCQRQIFNKCRQLHVTAQLLSSAVIDFVFDDAACDLSLSILK